VNPVPLPERGEFVFKRDRETRQLHSPAAPTAQNFVGHGPGWII
jgi:hypothetical protein